MRGVYSHMITDQYHHFHDGGEGYHTIYSSWEFLRGQEGDTWRPLVEEPPKPKGARALDFVGNHEAQDWHLHLEVFDPHVPLDCPARYRERYGDRWDRYHFTWPCTAASTPSWTTRRRCRHIRACYGGALTMADHWLGKLLDKLDEHRM